MSTTISGDTGIDKFEGTTIAGHVIQVANYTTGAMATGTALIPMDNTIPQITEGTQFMSLSFTPKKDTSKLKITVVAQSAVPTTSGWGTTALFRNSVSNAIGAVPAYYHAAGGIGVNISFVCFIDALSASLSTFTVRIGHSNAQTLTFNGTVSTAYMGGSLTSSITIEEIAQ